ncbi:zinc finger and BTB domain-containing protein 40 isoform X1 [Takifugu rubripes]|uniref:zinc finger and BTB domain-containing protein 40 isoform X1 n=1 Tax=Takifugu rubripes TaxID=31033 RepID=UPI0005D19B86|nr:zinc finger and BTB domain-containing protein 40 isoform X1 [Takifugu rubripes]|eukprot:XP_011615341.1 PREDICTED: zinc finger and BTB domain-containing protein 40 isoform X1 [Takifugu rubripes]
MMELPNYSSQLMQQLWTLRKEGQFCDCTILVGETPHRAHKLLLAASSMLFRSLLEGSDTITIDTTVVSSQEFGCLLDMVYTGKLPVGKHNVSRIVAAADSLQMFDVAVGFKKVLTQLVKQQPPVQLVYRQTPDQTPTPNSKAQSQNPEHSPLVDVANMSLDNTEPKKEFSESHHEDREEPGCKRTNLEPSKSTEPEAAASDSEENNTATTTTTTTAEPFEQSLAGVEEQIPQLVKLLSGVPSVQQLLSQAAQTTLDEQERQLVCQCCEEDSQDPSSVLEKLSSRVREGQLGRTTFLQLLGNIQQNVPLPFPPELCSLLEEVQKNRQELQEPQRPDEKDDGDESEEREDANPPCPSPTFKLFSCRWCKKNFSFKCRMSAHLRRCPMSPENQKQCPKCPTKLPSQRALKKHQVDAHCGSTPLKKKVACDLCGRTFAHPSGMIYHKRTEHFDEKPFSCDECGAKFAANSSLKNHMRLHTGEKPYCCKHCNMNFSVAAALAYHTKKKHSEGKMYVCQYCKAEFAQSIELTRHVRTHTGDRPYVCRECGKGYSQAHGLSIHLQTFHNLSEPHDCQKCCLSFSTLEEHRQHMQEFHPKEFHKCPTCDKVFTSSALLDKHKSTHVGSKPFSCDLCNKSYQQLSGLWYHNRTNHPEVFASHTWQLKTLIQCDVCFKFFPNAATLAKHQAAENKGQGAAAHCPYCAAVLGREDELQEHISSQHQCGEALGCPLCSALCRSHTELQEHLMSAHVEQESAEEPSATSHTTMSSDITGSGEAGTTLSDEQAQSVLVSLSETSTVNMVEVNMYELLNSSVSFISQDKPPHPGSEV